VTTLRGRHTRTAYEVRYADPARRHLIDLLPGEVALSVMEFLMQELAHDPYGGLRMHPPLSDFLLAAHAGADITYQVDDANQVIVVSAIRRR
jgi:hypothetical protein